MIIFSLLYFILFYFIAKVERKKRELSLRLYEKESFCCRLLLLLIIKLIIIRINQKISFTNI